MTERMTEADAERAFGEWLASDGWTVIVERQGYVDVVATRDGVTLYAEVKGHTSDPGVAVDIGYGQLLRRMEHGHENARYAFVVPETLRRQAERVPAAVRERAGIELYIVHGDRSVEAA